MLCLIDPAKFQELLESFIIENDLINSKPVKPSDVFNDVDVVQAQKEESRYKGLLMVRPI